jgi:hypothetical protein
VRRVDLDVVVVVFVVLVRLVTGVYMYVCRSDSLRLILSSSESSISGLDTCVMSRRFYRERATTN